MLPFLASVARLRFEPPIYLLALFAKIACDAVVLAALFHVIDTPITTIQSFRVHPQRLLMLVGLTAVLVVTLGSAGLFASMVAVVALEFFYRTPQRRWSTVFSFLVPALYMLIGVTLVWDYNDIIASLRFPATFDPVFMRMDSWLGVDVSAMSKKAVALFSPAILVWSEQIYFRMFDVMGAALILITYEGGIRRGMQFVGAVMLAYYVALIVFVVFPSEGPFYLCVDHATSFPSTSISYPIQLSFLAQARQMWEHTSTITTPGGYLVSFPCMHVVKPTVALWYLRDRKRIAALLCAYLVILPIAIMLLEWHYFVDIVAGFAVALVVIYVSDPTARVFTNRGMRTILVPAA